MSDLHARVDDDFTYHAPTAEMVPTFTVIRAQARALAHDLVDRCPPGRELSLALTSLEETVFWANAAIARQGEAAT